jgi:hypothetical protein
VGAVGGAWDAELPSCCRAVSAPSAAGCACGSFWAGARQLSGCLTRWSFPPVLGAAQRRLVGASNTRLPRITWQR